MSQNPPKPNTLKTVMDTTLPKIKIGIYLLVFLYAAYVIVFGTTFFSEFERMMIYAGVLTVPTVIFFVWFGIALQKKKLEKN